MIHDPIQKADVVVRLLGPDGQIVARASCSAFDLSGRSHEEQEVVVASFARECLKTIRDLYETRAKAARS